MVISLSVMVLPFIPATNLFFYVGFVVAERVLYIPSMGYCLLVAWGCHVIDDVMTSKYRSPRARTIFRCVLLALLAIYSARTIRRNHDWLTEESLYRSGIHINPPKGIILFFFFLLLLLLFHFQILVVFSIDLFFDLFIVWYQYVLLIGNTIFFALV